MVELEDMALLLAPFTKEIWPATPLLLRGAALDVPCDVKAFIAAPKNVCEMPNGSESKLIQMKASRRPTDQAGRNVDGFRFELGIILGRKSEGFDQRSGFFMR
jgi:hypothetical protein